MKSTLKFCLALLLCSITVINCKDDDQAAVPTPDSGLLTILREMSEEINKLSLYENPGHDFGFIMQLHHQGAIDMSKKLLEKGDDATLRNLAQTIITRNEQELIELKNFLDGHTPTSSENGKTFDLEAKAALSTMSSRAEAETLTGDADDDFASLLLIHHQAAVSMSQSYLRLGTNPTLRALVEEIRQNQTDDINLLEDWLVKAQK